MRGLYFYGSIIALTTAVVAADAAFSVQNLGVLDASIGTQVALEGVVAEDPVVATAHQKIVLKVEGDGGKEEAKIIAFAPAYPSVAYGDVVIARGMLKRPEPFETESGRTFNYPAYLAKDGIFYVLDKPRLAATGDWRGSIVQQRLIGIRRAFVAAIRKNVPEPYAGFAAGVVLGVDGALSKNDEAMFRDAGLVHIIVVSGYNITLVGDTVARLLSSLPPVASSFGSFLGIVAFIMLTGASATAVRAGIMASLVLLARVTKRRYNMPRALFAAGFLMVLHNPDILLHDPSFQLSFLATWGLATLTPFAQKCFRFIPCAGLRDIAATTLATQTAVTPLLISMSGTVSLLALPANILALPVVPFIMAGTLVIGILGFTPYITLLPVSLVVHGMSAYVFSVAGFVQDMPLNSIELW